MQYSDDSSYKTFVAIQQFPNISGTCKHSCLFIAINIFGVQQTAVAYSIT